MANQSATLGATILKKCSREWHKPASNKSCGAGTCQHTCSASAIKACQHSWTVRYSANGTQREKSFRDEINPASGKVIKDSGLRKAKDFQLELTRGKRAAGKTFVDPKAADGLFIANAEKYVAGLDIGEDTRSAYAGILRNYVAKAFAGRTLADMATSEAADDIEKLVNKTMGHQARQRRGVARMICVGTMNAAQRAGKIATHKMIGIEITEGTHISKRDARADDEGEGLGFVFLTDAQVSALVDGYTVTRTTMTGKARQHTLKGVGIAATLQRRMGLRIREALGAERGDFRERKDGSHYLRLREQATEDGSGRCPLKHRKPGQGRDIPVPDDIWTMVQAMPEGPLCPGLRTRYMPYNTAWNRFSQIIDAMGIEGVTSHSLRHQFASETLELVGVNNIAALSTILGHQNTETTLRIYVHPSADAVGKIASAMGATAGKPRLSVAA